MCKYFGVTLFGYTADHHRQGLAVVERLTPAIVGLESELVGLSGVRGAIVLATCNRVEIFTELNSTEAIDQIQQALTTRLGECSEFMDRLEPEQVIPHLFRLASGLESQVIGEREITGQMRRALSTARRDQNSSFLLEQAFEAAIRTSKKVEHSTGLAGRGRSIVAVGLTMIAEMIDLAEARAVIVGTGNYAGAVASALRDRQVAQIQVYSESGRAQRFAEMHRLVPVPGDGLITAIAESDLVITCRGFGHPAIPVAKVEAALAQRTRGRPLALLDLAVTHDVEAQVADLDGVHVIDLAAIREAVPEADRQQVSKAEGIIAEALVEFSREQSVRGIGGDIAALREWADRLRDLESARLGADPSLDTAKAALTRLSAAMAHLPTVLMRRAAADGRAEELLADIRDLIAPGSVEGRL